jgi:hypothetical protein
MNTPKWEETKETIDTLAGEFETKLKEVRTGAQKSAGAVQVSGTIMQLSSSAQNTAIHEFAHSISMERQTKFGLYDEGEFWKEIREIRTAYRRDVGQDTTRWISNYAQSSKEIDEFMAEAFALGYMREKGYEIPEAYGNDTKYSSMVLSAVRKYFGR